MGGRLSWAPAERWPVDAPRPAIETGASDRDDASLLADEKTLFTGRVDPRFAPRLRTRVELAVDTTRLHFFDGHDGGALSTGYARSDRVTPLNAE